MAREVISRIIMGLMGMLCSYQATGSNYTDLVSLPSYIDSISVVNGSSSDDISTSSLIVRRNDEGSVWVDERFIKPVDGSRCFCRWYFDPENNDTCAPLADVPMKFKMKEDKDFNLSIYSHGLFGGFGFSESDPLDQNNSQGADYYNREITFSVIDSLNNPYTLTVDNTYPGVWVSFPVSGTPDTDITLTMTIDPTVSEDISVSAITFDPQRGESTKFTYDSYRDLTEIKNNAGNTAEFTYNTTGTLTKRNPQYCN